MTGGTPVAADVDAEKVAADIYTTRRLIGIQDELLACDLPPDNLVNGWLSALVYRLRIDGLHEEGAAALRLAADDLDAERRRGAN